MLALSASLTLTSCTPNPILPDADGTSASPSAEGPSLKVDYVRTEDFNRFLRAYATSIKQAYETGLTEDVVETLRVVFPGEKRKSKWTNSVLASSKNPITITVRKKSKIDLDQTSLNQSSLEFHIKYPTELEGPDHNPRTSEYISAGWISDYVFEIDRLLSTTCFTFENEVLMLVTHSLKEGFIDRRRATISYEEDPRDS